MLEQLLNIQLLWKVFTKRAEVDEKGEEEEEGANWLACHSFSITFLSLFGGNGSFPASARRKAAGPKSTSAICALNHCPACPKLCLVGTKLL